MSRKKQVNQKITALYCRISLEDGGDNESMSISNQKLMLRDLSLIHIYGLQDNFMIKYPKLIKTATEKLANVREDVKAVSYTHLDVYKRQDGYEVRFPYNRPWCDRV